MFCCYMTQSELDAAEALLMVKYGKNYVLHTTINDKENQPQPPVIMETPKYSLPPQQSQNVFMEIKSENLEFQDHHNYAKNMKTAPFKKPAPAPLNVQYKNGQPQYNSYLRFPYPSQHQTPQIPIQQQQHHYSQPHQQAFTQPNSYYQQNPVDNIAFNPKENTQVLINSDPQMYTVYDTASNQVYSYMIQPDLRGTAFNPVQNTNSNLPSNNYQKENFNPNTPNLYPVQIAGSPRENPPIKLCNGFENINPMAKASECDQRKFMKAEQLKQSTAFSMRNFQIHDRQTSQKENYSPALKKQKTMQNSNEPIAHSPGFYKEKSSKMMNDIYQLEKNMYTGIHNTTATVQ